MRLTWTSPPRRGRRGCECSARLPAPSPVSQPLRVVRCSSRTPSRKFFKADAALADRRARHAHASSAAAVSFWFQPYMTKALMSFIRSMVIGPNLLASAVLFRVLVRLQPSCRPSGVHWGRKFPSDGKSILSWPLLGRAYRSSTLPIECIRGPEIRVPKPARVDAWR